jgi:hypothetical protein
VTVDEYLNYTKGLEYIDGRMQTKNGVEVLVPRDLKRKRIDITSAVKIQHDLELAPVAPETFQ